MIDSPLLTRRRALQMIAAGAAAAVVPPRLASAVSERFSGGRSDGIAVLVFLEGGNDHLGTVAIADDSTYREMRGPLALGDDALALPHGWSLHPSLPTIKRLWDDNHVSCLHGVGLPTSTFSHFDAANAWMSAEPTLPTSGWAGRLLDRITANDPLSGVAIGTSVPLLLRTGTRSALALPASLRDAFGIEARESDPSNVRLFEAVRAIAASDHGHPVLQRAAVNAEKAMNTATLLAGEYSGLDRHGGLALRMAAAARIASAPLGVRVVSVTHQGFDTHANQGGQHRDRLQELDQGIAAFYEELDPAVADRVVLVLFSEFGRRPRTNGSAGTDHGTAGGLWAIGTSVNSGQRGAPANLRKLEADGNLPILVDFRTALGEVLEPYFGGAAIDALGRP